MSWTGKAANLLRERLLPFPAQELDTGATGLESLDEPADSLLDEYLSYYRLQLAAEYPGIVHRIGRVDTAGFEVAVQSWSRPGVSRSMLLVHGYFDHVGIYGHLLRFALNNDYNVIAFDLPGHGLSSGERASIDDFAQYQIVLQDVLDAVIAPTEPVDVMAQSTGGAIIMDALLGGGGGRFDRIVLLAPLVRPTEWFQIRLAHTLLRPFVDSVPRHFVDNSGDRDFLEFLRQDPLQPDSISVRWVSAFRRWLPVFLAQDPSTHPLLAIQGDNDGTVDGPWNLQQIERLFPASRQLVLPGGRHHLANESSDLRGQYLWWVASYLDRDTATGQEGVLH